MRTGRKTPLASPSARHCGFRPGYARYEVALLWGLGCLIAVLLLFAYDRLSRAVELLREIDGSLKWLCQRYGERTPRPPPF